MLGQSWKPSKLSKLLYQQTQNLIYGMDSIQRWFVVHWGDPLSVCMISNVCYIVLRACHRHRHGMCMHIHVPTCMHHGFLVLRKESLKVISEYGHPIKGTLTIVLSAQYMSIAWHCVLCIVCCQMQLTCATIQPTPQPSCWVENRHYLQPICLFQIMLYITESLDGASSFLPSTTRP